TDPEPSAETAFARFAARILRGEELAYAGRAKEALDLAKSAFLGANVRGFATLERWAAWLVGENLRLLGRLGEARSYLEPALDRAVAAGNDSVALRLRQAIAHTLLLEGKPERARAIAGSGIPEARAIDSRRVAVLSRAQAAAGDAIGALEI